MQTTARNAPFYTTPDGLITLPASRIKVKRRRAQAEATSQSDVQPAIEVPVHELPPLRLEVVTERPVLRYGLDKTKVEGPQVARSAKRALPATRRSRAPTKARVPRCGLE